MPVASPGRSTFVPLPKPKRRTQWSKRSGPSSMPIFTEPTFDDWARMSPTVSVTCPRGWDSLISRSATWSVGGRSNSDWGSISFSSSAPATVKALKVEPGS